MPKAEHAHTTPKPTVRRRPAPLAGAHPAAVPPFLSIYDLGCCLAAIDAEYNRLEKPDGSVDKALSLLSQREEALSELISALPAKSIADAAVQIGVACVYADILTACEWSKPEVQEKLERSHNALLRILLSVLPHVAAAAGLDMRAMAWYPWDRRRDILFSDPEAVA